MELLRRMVEDALTQLDLPHHELIPCIEACLETSAVATLCADACIHEREPQKLRHCARLAADSADVCTAVVRLLCRGGQPDPSALRAMLEACASICRTSSSACTEHGEEFAHCRVAGTACDLSARACTALLEALLEAPSA